VQAADGLRRLKVRCAGGVTRRQGAAAEGSAKTNGFMA